MRKIVHLRVICAKIIFQNMVNVGVFCVSAKIASDFFNGKIFSLDMFSRPEFDAEQLLFAAQRCSIC